MQKKIINLKIKIKMNKKSNFLQIKIRDCFDLGETCTSYGTVHQYLMYVMAENFPCTEINTPVVLQRAESEDLDRQIYESLKSNSGDFHIFQNGCDIVVEGGSIVVNRNSALIKFGENEQTNGLINGVRTARIIELAKKNQICIDKQQIKVNVFVFYANAQLSKQEKEKAVFDVALCSNFAV